MDAINYAKEHNVVLLSLPAHTSNKLQPPSSEHQLPEKPNTQFDKNIANTVKKNVSTEYSTPLKTPLGSSVNDGQVPSTSTAPPPMKNVSTKYSPPLKTLLRSSVNDDQVPCRVQALRLISVAFRQEQKTSSKS